MTMRCYKYWATPASADDARRLFDQLHLAGDYRHALVEIENRSRALLRSLWATPMYAVPIPERSAWREAGGDAIIKAWTATDEYKEWRGKIQRESYAAVKLAYNVAGETGLAWGTRLAVGEAVDQARRTTAWSDDLGHARCSRVAVQIQLSNPLSCAAAVGGEDTRLRVGAELYALGERVDGYRLRAQGEVKNRGGNVRPRRLREVAMRTGSDGRAPIWSRLHVLMHRPLPEGQIKGAWAQCRFVGGRAEWEVVFSIDLGDRPAQTHQHPTRTIAINLGWRRRENGMRVAYWHDDEGQHGEIVIPIEVEHRKAKSDDLRSIRDLRRNAFVDQLRAWLDATSAESSVDSDESSTPWLHAALAHVRQWIRMGHFIKLEKRWRDERVAGDEAIYAELVAFLKQDRHLYAWQAHNLVRMARQIHGRFARIAHEMCAQYGVVAIESVNLTQLKEVEDDARINARSIQRLAPGEFRVALKQAAPKYGTVVQELEAAYSTLDCSECGHRREPQDRAALILTCEKCGHAEDQDLTATKNRLRASGQMRDADGRPLDPKAARTSAKKLAPRRTRKRVVDRPLATG